MCRFQEMFTFYHFQYRQSCRTSQMVSTKSGSQQPMGSLEVGMDQHTANRVAIAHAFGGRNQIWLKPRYPLMRKELSSPAIPRLHFIQDQLRPVFLAQNGQDL